MMVGKYGCDSLSTVDLVPMVIVIGTFLVLLGWLLVHSFYDRHHD